MPSDNSKLNCEVLWDDFAFEVRWAVAGDSIVLQLVARLENDEYMSFGLSGDSSRSRMVGGDVVVAWVDKESLKGYAKDYYLDAKSQCSGGRGSCPDENIEGGADSVRLLNAALVNGYSIVTFQRSLKAQDDLDKEVFTNASQPIIWAVGPLNSRKEVSYHSLANRGDIYVDFGRAPKWNCPTPESISEQGESEETSVGREQEEIRIQDPNRRESRPKTQIPTPAPAPKSGAWEIPAIKCYEPEDGVFYAQMGPTGGKHGYSAITGHVGWGISWYINGLLIPEINVVRGRTYTFIVEGGLDPETPARYHPFYITDDPVGGYQYKTPQERANIQIFAGAVQNKRGEVRPTGVGRLCNWTPDPSAPPADEFSSFGAYQRTLRLECDPGNPGIIQWTVEKDTPDTVYYQCYTHRYLGWKINVHDNCEGEAGSDPVPSVVKAPTSISKYYEEDTKGSESINFEMRIKPDAELLKTILEKSRTQFKPNQLVNEDVSNKAVISGPEKYTEISAGLPQQSLLVSQPFFFRAKTPVNFPLKPGYSVIEEPSEGIQNFQIVPLSFPQAGQLVNGPQKLRPEESFRLPEQIEGGSKLNDNYFTNRENLEASVEEERKRKNHKPPLPGKLTGPIRLRKPLPHNALTLQQRPFPSGAFRPPPMTQKLQKRPSTLSSFKVYNFPTKTPHHRVNVALRPEDFNKKETQLNRQIKRPIQKQESLVIGHHDLFGSSTISKQTSQIIPFAQNSGFDPQSVQVESGFKPILNTGVAPKSDSVLTKRADLEVAERTDEQIGVIASEAQIAMNENQENLKAHKKVSEVVRNSDEVDLFRDQKPQTFEPIFVPSRPDESHKKYPEKFKKKPLMHMKPRYDGFSHNEPQRSEEIFVKVRPSASVVRRPLHPDIVAPPFRIPQQERTSLLRSHETVAPEGDLNLTNGLRDTHKRAENILEVLEKSEENNNRSESTAVSTGEKLTDDDDDIAQDEMAMANERKEFYLPPKADEFLSYDGKVVKAVETPVLPEASPPTDLSKLPQFVPFKGAIPPLNLAVDAESLPQLKSSKLAREDILPSASPVVKNVFSPKLSTTFQTSKLQERKKRSPDHIPGHEGHEHHHHHHDHHSNASSSIASNLFHIALVFFPLTWWKRYFHF